MSQETVKWEFKTTLLPSPGLHPWVQLTLSLLKDDDADDALPPPPCLASILFEHIPPSLFIDRFQLQALSVDGHLERVMGSDPAFVSHTTSARPVAWGSKDLEAPVSLASHSGLLIPLPHFTHAARQASNALVELKVPFHLRYLDPLPSLNPGTLEVVLSGPTLVWSCNASVLSNLQPIITSSTPITIFSPTGNQADLVFVEIITSAVVWLAFAWIAATTFQSCHHVKRKVA